MSLTFELTTSTGGSYHYTLPKYYGNIPEPYGVDIYSDSEFLRYFDYIGFLNFAFVSDEYIGFANFCGSLMNNAYRIYDGTDEQPCSWSPSIIGTKLYFGENWIQFNGTNIPTSYIDGELGQGNPFTVNGQVWGSNGFYFLAYTGDPANISDLQLVAGTCSILPPDGTHPTPYYRLYFGEAGSIPTFKDFFANADFGLNTDPYNNENPTGPNWPGGAGGAIRPATDPISLEILQPRATNSGFVTLYNPTKAQLNSLATYMWSSYPTDLWRKLFADPMDCILGLSLVPVSVPSSSTGHVYVGDIQTPVTMNIASSQFISVDCGSVTIRKKWGAYLDYEPYTTASIYLPYIGAKNLSVDEIMGRTVNVVYRVNLFDGGCMATIKVDGTVMYQFPGNCASQIPVSGRDWSEMLATSARFIASAATAAMTGGASVVGGQAARVIGLGSEELSNVAAGNLALQGVADFAQSKPTVERSGNTGGSAGFLGVQKPFIIMHIPNVVSPSDLNTFTGYPSYVTKKLGDCKGFTSVYSIKMENKFCTKKEYDEILLLLHQGVVL